MFPRTSPEGEGGGQGEREWGKWRGGGVDVVARGLLGVVVEMRLDRRRTRDFNMLLPIYVQTSLWTLGRVDSVDAERKAIVIRAKGHFRSLPLPDLPLAEGEARV